MSYESIIKPSTWAAMKRTCLQVLAGFEFPTFSWEATDLPTGIVEFESKQLADLTVNVANIGRMGVLDDAEKDALDLHAYSNFSELRKPAVAAEFDVTLRNSLASAQNWAAAQLVVTSTATAGVFRNVAPVALAGNGTAIVRVRADVAGADSTPGASLVLGAPVPGVSLTANRNVAVLGVAEESDVSLRNRCRLKWAALTSRGPKESYQYWGLSSHPEINRVGVVESLGTMGVTPDVTVLAASPSGTLSGAALAAFEAAIELHRPVGVRVVASAAVRRVIDVCGQVRVRSAYKVAAQVEAERRLKEYFASLPLGQTVYHAPIIALVQSIPGVELALLSINNSYDDGDRFLTTYGSWALEPNEVAALNIVIAFVDAL